jgi:hypothetical protein
MALSDEDKLDLKQAVYEVYDELFSHSIDFIPFDVENNDTDLYEERKYKNYLDPIPLIGGVKIESGEETLQPTGVKVQYDAKFEIPVLELETKEVLDLGEEVISKSRMKYQGITYSIVNFEPTNMVADIFLMYKITAKRVEDED